jgi:hypothetical protein
LLITKVLCNNPDCKKQYEDLPYSAEYPSLEQKIVVSLVNALMSARVEVKFV